MYGLHVASLCRARHFKSFFKDLTPDCFIVEAQLCGW